MFRADVAYVMTSMLRSVVEEGTAKAAKVLGRPLAGKTGSAILPPRPGRRRATSDVWFVGYSPDLVVGTWIGYDDQHDLGSKETGGRSALKCCDGFSLAPAANRMSPR